MCRKHPITPFSQPRRAVKHVQACLSADRDREIIFYHCEGPVQLVQTCLCAVNTLQRRFNRRWGIVKHVQASLCARKDGESSFHKCRCLVQACLCLGNTIQRRFDSRKWAVKNVQASLSARKDGESSFHHCGSPSAGLFMCGKHPTTPFSLPRRRCEARAGLFKS